MTAEIVRWSKHRLHRCNNERCPVCEGGLQYCEVCFGAEDSLTTDCSGEKLSLVCEEMIVKEGLDYERLHGWVFLDGTRPDPAKLLRNGR